MKDNTLTITEVAVIADELQSLLCILYEKEDVTPEFNNCIGIAWKTSCRISTWLTKQDEKND